jgi:ribosomal protein L32
MKACAGVNSKLFLFRRSRRTDWEAKHKDSVEETRVGPYHYRHRGCVCVCVSTGGFRGMSLFIWSYVRWLASVSMVF